MPNSRDIVACVHCGNTQPWGEMIDYTCSPCFALGGRSNSNDASIQANPRPATPGVDEIRTASEMLLRYSRPVTITFDPNDSQVPPSPPITTRSTALLPFEHLPSEAQIQYEQFKNDSNTLEGGLCVITDRDHHHLTLVNGYLDFNGRKYALPEGSKAKKPAKTQYRLHNTRLERSVLLNSNKSSWKYYYEEYLRTVKNAKEEKWDRKMTSKYVSAARKMFRSQQDSYGTLYTLIRSQGDNSRYATSQVTVTKGWTAAKRTDILQGLRFRIQAARRQAKSPDDKKDGFFGDRIGLVYTKGANVSKFSEQKKIDACFSSKYPRTGERHYGIEIECYGDTTDRDMARLFAQSGLWRYVEIASDGSIEWDMPSGTTCEDEDCSCHDGDLHGGLSSKTRGYEFKVCAPESKLRWIIKELSKILVDQKFQVNRSCGLHVHLDARAINHKKVFKRLVRAEDALTMLVPSSRRRNNYCEPTEFEDLDEALDNNDRYKRVNATALETHNTIEVRLHSGTIDAHKILAWCDLLKAISKAPRLEKTKISEPAELVKQVKMSKRLKRYVMARAKKFSNVNIREDVDDFA